jgi:hypothetical protein
MILADLCILFYANYENENRVLSPTVLEWHTDLDYLESPLQSRGGASGRDISGPPGKMNRKRLSF